MKKIKIFIGSSIDDLAYERRDLVSPNTNCTDKLARAYAATSGYCSAASE